MVTCALPRTIGHVRTRDKVYRLWAAQVCNRSAKRGCSQVVAMIGLRSQIFRKANDTITKMDLWNNKIGDAGAAALAESLKAMFVTCVLQVRTSLFLWHVCAHIHRRRSATCRETVLACCSMRFSCVDVCELLGVSRREVRQDVMHCGRVLRCL